MNLEKLVKDHAYWADRVRELKNLGEKAAGGCARRLPRPGMSDEERWRTLNADSCIAAIYVDWHDDRTESAYGDQCSFEEVWDEARADGSACDACQRVRDLRAERMTARKRLGAVRAAITRVGRRMTEDSGNVYS